MTATVVTNCQVTVSDLAFGAYDPLGAHANQQLDGSAAVRVVCTRSAGASIELDSGENNSGSQREMSSGTTRIQYQLYRDSNRTRAWSRDSDAVHLVSSSARDSQQFTVYARVPAGQKVASGLYTDVVRATVYF
jgi:spore coat protein U-like protein